MTEIESIKEEIILFKEMIDDNNPETTEFLTNNLTSVYHSIFFDKTLTSLVYPMESDKLLVSIELFV